MNCIQPILIGCRDLVTPTGIKTKNYFRAYALLYKRHYLTPQYQDQNVYQVASCQRDTYCIRIHTTWNLIVWFCRESETVAVLRHKYTRYNTSEMVGREDVQGTDAGPKPENLRSQPKERTFSGFLCSLWPARAKSDAGSQFIQHSGTHFRPALISHDAVAQSELEEPAFILPENKQGSVIDRPRRNPVRAVRKRQSTTTKDKTVSSRSDLVGDHICSICSKGDETVSTEIGEIPSSNREEGVRTLSNDILNIGSMKKNGSSSSGRGRSIASKDRRVKIRSAALPSSAVRRKKPIAIDADTVDGGRRSTMRIRASPPTEIERRDVESSRGHNEDEDSLDFSSAEKDENGPRYRMRVVTLSKGDLQYVSKLVSDAIASSEQRLRRELQQQVLSSHKALARDLKVVTEAVQHFTSVSKSVKELEKAIGGNAGAAFIHTVPAFPSGPRGRPKVAKNRTNRLLRDEDVLSQDGTLLEEINAVFDAFVLSQGTALTIAQSMDRYHGLEDSERTSERVWAIFLFGLAPGLRRDEFKERIGAKHALFRFDIAKNCLRIARSLTCPPSSIGNGSDSAATEVSSEVRRTLRRPTYWLSPGFIDDRTMKDARNLHERLKHEHSPEPVLPDKKRRC